MNQRLAMRALVRLVETGSFSRTADHLALPRSTVSKLIIDLEKHLGTRLLNRTTRAVAATSDGLEYYGHAVRLLAEVDSVDRALRGKKVKPSGHLRVDAPASFATCLLIPALADFHREYPDITIALGISDRTVNIVGEGVDCAIRAGSLNEMTMIGRRLAELQYVTCAAPGYLERMGTPSSPADLEKNHAHTAYFFAATGKLDPMIFEMKNHRYEVAGCAFSTNDGNGLLEMVLSGLGIGQHLRRCVQPHLDSGELVAILEDWTRPPLPLHIVYPSNRHPNARLSVFIGWAIQNFGEGASAR
ncbi:LysR substrate-binding domain-containing protein [Sorangium sp. So ce1099]|uniref:LysR substrate-binding domain-containing protein n=1 Tax=Sorangium sp. So ce1099 TaxID=3133331 RepID=UPI003F61302C